MNATDSRRFVLLGLALCAAGSLLAAAPTAAQQSGSRFRVLVAELASPNARQGQKVAEAIRASIDAMDTHVSVPDKEVKAALKKLGVKNSGLGCVEYRQLMQHVEAQLVMCGAIDAAGQVTAQFFNPDGGSYDVPAFAFVNEAQAAQQVVSGFGDYVQMLRVLTYCDSYLRSSQWEPALDNCNQALAMNPKNAQALYGRGSALANLERHEEALAAFQQVLEIDPTDENALKHAAFTSSKLERADLTRKYMNDILAMNPGDTQVRLNLAADLAREGDPAAALALLEDIEAKDTVNLVLREYAGHFAMRAGGDRVSRSDTAAARRMFEKAVGHYEYAARVKGDTTPVIVLRNLMVAHNALGHTPQALSWGERATTHADCDVATWSAYADALRSAARLQDALAALDHVQQMDPAYAVAARRAFIYMDLGRMNDAVAAIRQAASREELPAVQQDQLAQKLVATGFENFQKARKYEQAYAHYDAARSIAPNEVARGMANFYHGYGLYEQARAIQDKGTLASAKEALPMFQRAKTLLEGAAAYASQRAGTAKTRQDLLNAIGTLIEIQEAIIKRG